MNEEKLLSEAQAVVGQDDVLLAAGVFQPRGTQAGMSGGAAVGGSLARGGGDGVHRSRDGRR